MKIPADVGSPIWYSVLTISIMLHDLRICSEATASPDARRLDCSCVRLGRTFVGVAAWDNFCWGCPCPGGRITIAAFTALVGGDRGTAQGQPAGGIGRLAAR